MNDDMTRLSYWFPKIQAAGLPVPKTEIIKSEDDETQAFYELALDGVDPKGKMDSLVCRIRKAGEMMGFPCFLRTDHTSAKHDWERTCYLKESSDISNHMAYILNFWEMVNWMAPRCDVWVVREFLPTIPIGACPKYSNMPVCKEFRFFVDGPEVKCWHPYWPLKALNEGGAIYNSEDFSYEDFCQTPDINELRNLASAAGKAVGGEWSVDILETRRGWYITDMAEAYKSWHWEGCPNGKKN